MTRKQLAITTGIAVLVITVALFTVLSKPWWKRRIDSRYPFQLAKLSDGTVGFRTWKDLKEYSLPELWKMYTQGDPLWYRTQEEYQAAERAMYAQGTAPATDTPHE